MSDHSSDDDFRGGSVDALFPPFPVSGTQVKPQKPDNAVVDRPHPPLYAGDFDNNLSRGMYWWQKLDPTDAEDLRVLQAMYYGQEREPRCNVCERRDRACMIHLGEENQIGKSCVKCRRVHATCRLSPECSNSSNLTVGLAQAEAQEASNVRKDSPFLVSRKRGPKEANAIDEYREQTQPPSKRTRSSFARRTQVDEDKSTDATHSDPYNEHPVRKLVSRRSNTGKRSDTSKLRVDTVLIDNSKVRVTGGVTSSPIDGSLSDDQPQLNGNETINDACVRPSGTYNSKYRRDASATVGRDDMMEDIITVEPPVSDDHRSDDERGHQATTRPAYTSSIGLDQVAQGLSTLIDECCKPQIQAVEAAFEMRIQGINVFLDNSFEARMNEHQEQIKDLKKSLGKQPVSGNTRGLEKRLLNLEKEKAGLGSGETNEIKRLEVMIEAERGYRRRLEDENMRLQNRIARLEGGQEAGFNDLQEQIRKLKDDINTLGRRSVF